MGIFVSEQYTNVNGFVSSECYVNIDNITILKSNLETYKYTVEADRRIYVSKQARNDNKKPVENTRIVISVDDLDNLHEQIYTEVKRSYENYTDDI